MALAEAGYDPQLDVLVQQTFRISLSDSQRALIAKAAAVAIVYSPQALQDSRIRLAGDEMLRIRKLFFPIRAQPKTPTPYELRSLTWIDCTVDAEQGGAALVAALQEQGIMP